MERLLEFVQDNKELMLKTLKELCLIPAPSNNEQKRAEYCKAWLEKVGAKSVCIDKALNVVFPINCENSNKITVVVAHTDTVFSDTEPMPYYDDGKNIFSPGVGDDTANLVVMLFVAKYFIENNISPENGIMFVCNSCEEGLGNLKGTRQIFNDYNGRIAKFISLDSTFTKIIDRCVGSHRYEVEVKTQGGHSFNNFGNANAIAQLSKIINKIYQIEVPKKENTSTSYNVGIIEGGTSVNTIAQSAKMLCEYRSDDQECLKTLQCAFESIFASAKEEGVNVVVKKVGDRPCMGNVDLNKIDVMAEICEQIITKITGCDVQRKSGSTDCNIPLSKGVPSICIGAVMGGGAHTREEWIVKDSLEQGLEIAINCITAILQ